MVKLFLAAVLVLVSAIIYKVAAVSNQRAAPTAEPKIDSATQGESKMANRTPIMSENKELVEKTYYPNERLRNAGAKVAGLREGRWEFFDPQGHLLSMQTFSQGVPQGRYELFHINGSIRKEGDLVDGKQQGEWRTYDLEGQVLHIQQFDNGKRVGAIDYYDSQGASWLRVDAKTGAILPTNQNLDNSGNATNCDTCGP